MTNVTNSVEVNAGEDTDIDVFELSETETPSEASPQWANLPLSSTLSIEEADTLLCWKDAAIVAIVGERNGGKTTLVTEMYSCFLRGPLAEIQFCHSLSLMGFEKKSFQSRAASGGLYPETPRTSSQDGLRFFHLALSTESDSTRCDLLISERAGETYREMRDMPERASEMVELRKASFVVFIIDGERVADARKRQEVYASVRSLTRACLLTANPCSTAQIQLVTTKYDLLESDECENARDSLKAFEESINDIVAGRFNVSAYHTSARNPKPGSVPAVGLAPLLQSWIRPLPPLSFNAILLPSLTDEFDRLMLTRRNQ